MSKNVSLSPEWISWKPRECAHLIQLGESKLKPSQVASGEGKGKRPSLGRTSEGAWLSKSSDEVTRAIEARIAAATHLPPEHGEALYLLRYRPGEFYKAHYDYFVPDKGRDRQLSRGGQRFVSFLMYLNEVEEGGETEFTRVGVKIKPELGLAMMFYNLLPNGSIDPLTKHQGCAVVAGEKWLATKWLRVNDRQAAKAALRLKAKQDKQQHAAEAQPET